MPTVKETAIAYEPKMTKNIADLEEFSLDFEMSDDSFETTDDDGKPKTVEQKVVEINGENYRVPNSVIEQIQTQLRANPNINKIKVERKGTGLATKYTVIVLE